MIDTSVPLFVLRRSLAELQHGVLGVARSAGRLGIPVYAVRQSRFEPATRSRYLHGTLKLPTDASTEAWIDALISFGRTHGRPLMLPIDDDAAVFAEDHHAELSGAFRLIENPPSLRRRLASKHELRLTCEAQGLPSPRSTLTPDEPGAMAAAAEYGYPVVLKRDVHWAPSCDPRAPSVLIAPDLEQLRHGYARMRSPDGGNILIQEYIPGGPESVWMFNGYFDAAGVCRCAFTGQKLRQRGPRTGPTTLGVCVWNQEVADLAQQLMSGVGYHGIVDMGLRFDARDGRYKLLDVNPRMGSTFRLFVDDDGLDVVRAAYLDLTGQPVPASRPRQGRRWVDEPYDLFVAVQTARQRELTPAAWARSFAGVEEAAWWARDDPAPFAAMVASLGGDAVRVIRQRRRQRPAARPLPSLRHRGQEVVDKYFDATAGYWSDVYHRNGGLDGLIYNERMEATLRWVDQLAPDPALPVLEVGAGAGLLAAELAGRGLHVTATDSSDEMFRVMQARAAGLPAAAGRLEVALADAHALPFADERFELVVALGLLPWLHDPATAVGELVRVLRPGGTVIVSADNRVRLNFLLEPRESPLLAPVKLARRAGRRATGRVARGVPSQRHRPSAVDRMLMAAGAEPVRRTTVGYGPFTVLGRPLLGDPAAVRVHRALSALSAERAPAVRRHGWHYLVAARKRPA